MIVIEDGVAVVDGTWVEAADIIQLLWDGVDMPDILRDYPELDVDDVRACVRLLWDSPNGEYPELGPGGIWALPAYAPELCMV